MLRATGHARMVTQHLAQFKLAQSKLLDRQKFRVQDKRLKCLPFLLEEKCKLQAVCRLITYWPARSMPTFT